METAWIQVFVLTLSECLAPAGKTICQEQELQMQFVSQADCELAREQFIFLADRADDVIIDKDKTRCEVTVTQQAVFSTQDDLRQHANIESAWVDSPPGDRTVDPARIAHQERLEVLPACTDVDSEMPCTVGEIIIEGEDEQRTDIWRKE